jgi:hypothetical protein
MHGGDVACLAGEGLEVEALVGQKGVGPLGVVAVFAPPHRVVARHVHRLWRDVAPCKIVIGPLEIDGDVVLAGIVGEILGRVLVDHPPGVVGGEVAVDADQIFRGCTS